MSFDKEQFSAANQAAVDSLLAVANTALASAERIAALNLETARSALENGASAMTAKNPQALAQPAVEAAATYSRSMYEIATDTQQELAKVVAAQFEGFQKSMAGMVAMAAKNAPTGSDSAVAAMQSAIAAANSAFGNMQAVAKQFADAAQANVEAAAKRTR